MLSLLILKKIPLLPLMNDLFVTSENLSLIFAISLILKKLPSAFALKIISPISPGFTDLFLALIKISSSADFISPAEISLLLFAMAPAIISKVKLYLSNSSSGTSTEISISGNPLILT